MAWAWVRPADPRVLDGRPLLDLGTGDGQTVGALVRGPGLVVGLDTSNELLRVAPIDHRVCGDAETLPFADAAFGCVLAGDLFHHLDDDRLAKTLQEAARVLRPGGRLVGWWYESSGVSAPDAPRHPRSFEDVAAAAHAFGEVAPLALELTLEPAPPTLGLVARR